MFVESFTVHAPFVLTQWMFNVITTVKRGERGEGRDNNKYSHVEITEELMSFAGRSAMEIFQAFISGEEIRNNFGCAVNFPSPNRIDYRTCVLPQSTRSRLSGKQMNDELARFNISLCLHAELRT
jgi:hypothetical protein